MKLLIGFMWLLHWLPLPILGRFGAGIGNILFLVMGPRREIALTNLRLCMPELTEAQRRTLARQHFQAYSRSVWERSILWWASEERLNRLIKKVPAFPGQQIASKPTILLCPHFVCLDVAGAATAMEIEASSMYVQQKNAVFDKALRDGLPYFMLPDMDFGEKDAEFVPFFGVPAATLTATARLALAARAQVIPVIATFLPNYQGWKVTYYPPWDDYPGDDITAATRRMNEFIEERVREAPAEYFWTHKRFKTRPAGEASFYHQQKPD